MLKFDTFDFTGFTSDQAEVLTATLSQLLVSQLEFQTKNLVGKPQQVKYFVRGSDSSDFTSLETLKFRNLPFQHILMYYPYLP